MMFGGLSGGTPAFVTRAAPVDLTCPTSENVFQIQLQVSAPPDDTVAEVAVSSSELMLDEEFASWFRESRLTARTYGQAMVAINAALIPAYFGVVQFVAGSRKLSEITRALSLLPAAFFTASLLCSVFGIYPGWRAVSRSEFPKFREGVLGQVHRRNLAATTIFLLGVVYSCVCLGSLFQTGTS